VALGLKRDTDREPFSMLRVTPGFVIQIAPWGTTGGEHLAFAMSKAEFMRYSNVFATLELPMATDSTQS
jgi:hypothetical protein